VVEKKNTKNSINVYKEKPKGGWLHSGVKLLQVQPIDGFFERIAFWRGQDVGTFSEVVLDDVYSMP
jgi:hypothetical protein